MSRKDDVRMPSSSAGVMSFYDEERSKIKIGPTHVVILTVIVIVFALILNYTSLFR